MTWLYIGFASAVMLRWSLWYLRDVVEWIEAPRRDVVSRAMATRLRLQRGHRMSAGTRQPAVNLSGEVLVGLRGA